ncbi:hypothetical protein M2347_004129 [Chryseobacterium sp. H1D6B]|uniref:T9SS type A sorting domain-containing protein n=1 Tax=Chryseobacterium sp. H1D6B TaxID=2940588 RepID=UPI0015C84A08|nr:T9SS type A sorting domain-containing protein [Chryseobacterium sp. H1D6B]MDH6254402.1 hypothetical protein [Chryseobacterium sp. H1D6B]
MKKSLLLLLFIGVFSFAQTLEEENFNSYGVGNFNSWVVTNFTHGTPNYPAPYRPPVLEIIQGNAAQDKVLKITAPNNQFMDRYQISKSADFSTLWNNRQPGNNIVKVKFQLYTKDIKGDISIGLFNTDKKMIAYLYISLEGRSIEGGAMAKNKSNNQPATYSVPLINNQPIPANTLLDIVYTYDYNTGNVTWETPYGAHVFDSSNLSYTPVPNQNISNQVFYFSFGSGAQVGVMLLDNYKVEAVANYSLSVLENNTKRNNEFLIYPNPSKDYIHINLQNIKKVEIIDMQGRVLENFYNSSRINISKLISGNYILKVISGNEVHTAKFTKE